MQASSPTAINSALPAATASAVCTLLGHRVHHTRIDEDFRTRCVRCDTPILGGNESASRVAHTLSCFLGWHHYVPVARRADHNEFVCERCGHPLLFAVDRDPYSSNSKFKKKVNYGCGLFGHRVHVVRTETETTEYACRCGHTFVRHPEGRSLVRHPLRCVLLGHWISFVDTRGRFSEYACRTCGHPFLFKRAPAALSEARRSRDRSAA